MTGSLLKLLSSLKEAKTSKDKKQASLKVLEFIEKSKDYSERLLENHLTQTLKIRSSSYFREIIEGELFRTRLKSYSDRNGELKVAYGVSFVQEFTEPEDNLEEQVSHLILNIIAEGNLESIFNDISVNSYQYVDMGLVEV